MKKISFTIAPLKENDKVILKEKNLCNRIIFIIIYIYYLIIITTIISFESFINFKDTSIPVIKLYLRNVSQEDA